MSKVRQMKVAVLGLGLMGSGIAQNLLARKHEVHGYNRTREKAKFLEEKGVVLHATPSDAVSGGVDVAITMLTDHNAVNEVALGPQGFLLHMKKGGLWVDMSTILPEESVKHAAESESRGVERLDAPVIGGPQPAAKGELIIVVGGKQSVYERHAGFLKELGKDVIYMGADGMGHKMKLAFNLFLGILATGFSEALVFAEKIGVNPQDFVSVVNKTHHRNGYTENKGVRVSRNDFTPTFTLSMMRKDLALIQTEAVLNGMSLTVASSVLDLFTAAANQGFAELDYSSIVKTIRRVNGITD